MKAKKELTEWLRHIRLVELRAVMRALPRNGVILELGTGNGWQAEELARLGFSVIGVDVPGVSLPNLAGQSILFYDGRTLPFRTGAFDVIFSSNTLEHVVEPEALSREMTRVLKPGGIAIHIVPTALWVSLGFVFHVPAVAQHLFCHFMAGQEQSRGAHGPKAGAGPFSRNHSLLSAVRWLALPLRHGERGTVFHEFFYFSRWGWRAFFRRHHWVLKSECSMPLLYSGHSLFKTLIPISFRRILARMFGSSTRCFMVRPSDAFPETVGMGS